MENWLFALLDELARASEAAITAQDDPDYAGGMRDEFDKLAIAARNVDWTLTITAVAANAWLHQQRERIRQHILNAQHTSDATFRVRYHEGRLAACSLVLIHLGTLPLIQ